MKILLLAGLLFITGCSMKGTQQHYVSPNYFYWEKNPMLFSDGDAKGARRYCGTAYKDEATGVWLAAASPDRFHEERMYHTAQAAITYVETWCQP